ncbi:MULTISPECIES: hypothetical protein [Streptomyces]|nr:hypothetical protein [Streptomyces sp. SID7805]MYU53575.1 hypothetical protein [Streptomyces sp. SID7805]
MALVRGFPLICWGEGRSAVLRPRDRPGPDFSSEAVGWSVRMRQLFV